MREDVLKNPIPILLNEIHKKVEGEDKAIKTIINTKAMEFVINKDPTSANLMVNAQSGSGKDFVTKNTLAIFPSETTLKRTRISPATLTYWHNSVKEPNWTWNGKSLYLEDISEGILNCPVFKVMSSGGSHATIVVNQVATDFKINGKPTLIITTATSNPNYELLRRFPIVILDESRSQTKSIKMRQAKAAMDGKTLEYNPGITNTLRSLKRVKVKIPFADQLVGIVPDSNVIMRTSFSRFLDYIKGSAALHQKSREIDADGFVIATNDDYDFARESILAITTNVLMIPVPRNQEKVLELWQNGSLAKDEPYLTSEILSKITWVSERQARYYLNVLVDRGFLCKKTDSATNPHRPSDKYSYIELEEFTLPTFDNIRRNAERLQ